MSKLTHTKQGDPLSSALTDVIKTYNPKTILEIGSSDGTGSTQTLLKSDAIVFCVEIDQERYADLLLNTRGTNAECYNLPSVGLDGVVPESYIDGFKAKHPDFNLWTWIGYKGMKTWWKNTVARIKEFPNPNGIKLIKEANAIEFFDMVLIDGGPFTGYAEMQEVYGANVIALDDIMDIKCHDAYEFLKSDQNYKLKAADYKYRNGFAIFVKC